MVYAFSVDAVTGTLGVGSHNVALQLLTQGRGSNNTDGQSPCGNGVSCDVSGSLVILAVGP